MRGKFWVKIVGSKKNLDRKIWVKENFWVKKIWEINIFGSKKKIWVKKNFWVKNLGSNKFLVAKFIFCQKIFWGEIKILDQKILYKQSVGKKIWVKNCLVKKIFDRKNFPEEKSFGHLRVNTGGSVTPSHPKKIIGLIV